MVPRASQAGVAIAIALCACDSPARVKPWRHAADPMAEAATAPGSPVLAEEPAAADVRAQRGHTLRIHMDAEPGRLSPVLSPSVWTRRILLGTVFEPLVRYEGSGHYAPRLARSWRVLSGGTEIRIELEPGATFHDGRPLTSSDVQFTLDTVRSPHKGVDHLRALLDDVDAVELITSHELRVRLKRPNGYVLRALAEIPILPMHVYDGSLFAGGALVGTGPWKYVGTKAGVLHLTRNDKYWAGRSPITDIEFVYQPDAAVALTAAKRGELDVIPALIPAHWPEQATAPGVTASFKPLQLAPPRFRYIQFNAAHPPLDDDRVRHALALLIDRRAIAKRVFDGLARPVLWPIWPGGPVDGGEAPVPEFDPAAAGKLLDAAGWIDSDKDGIRDKDGKQLRLVMVGGEKPAAKDASGPPVKTERDYLIEAARRTGVIIEVKSGGESWVAKRHDEGEYDLIEVAWGGMVDSDVSALVGGDPRVDRVLDQMTAAWDPAERTRLAADLTAALAESWPIAGIVADAPQGLVHNRVHNVKVWDGWLDLSQLALDVSP